MPVNYLDKLFLIFGIISIIILTILCLIYLVYDNNKVKKFLDLQISDKKIKIYLAVICIIFILLFFVLNFKSIYKKYNITLFIIFIFFIVSLFISYLLTFINYKIINKLSKNFIDSFGKHMGMSLFSILISLFLFTIFLINDYYQSSPQKILSKIILISSILVLVVNTKLVMDIIKNNNNVIDNVKQIYIFYTWILFLSLFILNAFVLSFSLNNIIPKSFVYSTDNNSINPFEIFYFVIVTFFTVGFGDIIPKTIFAKLIVICINFLSVIFLSLFVNFIFVVYPISKSQNK